MTINPFEFRNVPAIEVAWGGAKRLGRGVVERFASRKALLVTDTGLIRAGLIDSIIRDLTDSGITPTIFDQVVADPPERVVYACVEKARQSKADLIVGIGGGSSLDIAKLVAALVSSKQSLTDIYGIGKIQGSRLPLILVPTTAGTGSEVTNISIVTTGETTKMGIVSAQLYADYVLLDAELTVGLPQIHTAATGIDAMVHAIEAYTNRHKKNPISDALAREALRLLCANLITSCKQPSDRNARECMLLGAMMAGQAFANSPVAAVHALAYPLGGHFHIPHGLSNALMLGPVLRFNAKHAPALYAELASVVGIPEGDEISLRAEAFIFEMQRLMDESGAPRRLSEVGVTENSLSMLAEDAMKQTRLLVNNPIEVRQEDALLLYREAF
ncbi:iron-containing alcohol dehydrogenase [Rhizobium etli]|uniref:iron-containing alcohol dehydrogenase n=1 Tax=Rhizobium etli TaxID=29449 RepID=UPI0003839177|nr:iron-containing alcohol dehydrogenase [Rhizobium etli]AGS24456.1 alcohol dehydrogenase iron-type protein [Rhizobium etli bv. mimosae str. Mim1]